MDRKEPLWEVFNTTGTKVPVDFEFLKQLFLEQGLLPPSIEWTLLSRNKMQEVHCQFSQKNSPTDCLSFPSQNQDTPGSVLLCPKEIAFYACYYQIPLALRWTHLVIHSALHLCGYDHENTEDFEKMIEQERALLDKTQIYKGYFLTQEYTYQQV